MTHVHILFLQVITKLDVGYRAPQYLQPLLALRAQAHGSVRYRAFHIQMKIQILLKLKF